MNPIAAIIQRLNKGDTVTIQTQDHPIPIITTVLRITPWQETDFGGDTALVLTTTTNRIDLTIPDPPQAWHFPIGSDKYPPEQWYIATFHDLTGKANNGYEHSGIDYNVEVYPRGDIDRGQPVFAIASGRVYGTWHSERNLASVVIQVTHQGAPLYVRYWHLARDDTFLSLRPGLPVTVGQTLGHLGSYKPGGDHLHFDMALDPFHPGCWLIPAVRWIDPVIVLEYHLDPAIVEASLRK